MYFVDVLALRAGHEKSEGEVKYRGLVLTSLRMPNFVINFLAKDPIWFYNKVTVDEQVLKTIKTIKNDKNDSDGLFGRVNVCVMDGSFALCTPTMAHPVGST